MFKHFVDLYTQVRIYTPRCGFIPPSFENTDSNPKGLESSSATPGQVFGSRGIKPGQEGQDGLQGGHPSSKSEEMTPKGVISCLLRAGMYTHPLFGKHLTFARNVAKPEDMHPQRGCISSSMWLSHLSDPFGWRPNIPQRCRKSRKSTLKGWISSSELPDHLGQCR